MKGRTREQSSPSQPDPFFLPSSTDGFIQPPQQNPFVLPSVEELDALQHNVVNPFLLPPAIMADESSTLQQHASVPKNPFLISSQGSAMAAEESSSSPPLQDLFVIPSLASNTQMKPVIQKLDPSPLHLNDLLEGLSNLVANNNLPAAAEFLKLARDKLAVDAELQTEAVAPKSEEVEKTTASEADRPYLSRLFGGKKEKAEAATEGSGQPKKWIRLPKMDPKGRWPQGWY